MEITTDEMMQLTVDSRLHLLRHAVEDDLHLRLMSDIAHSIKSSERACDDAASEEQAYYDMMCDDECDYIEDLIGASFLVLQTKIRRVVSRAVSLREAATEVKIAIPQLKNATAILEIDSEYKGTGHSFARLAWEVGNYFKHRDEWRSAEGGDSSQGQKTWDIVGKLGIRPHSTGNLRTAYEFFGIDPYSSCERLAVAVQEWAESVYGIAKTELEQAGFEAHCPRRRSGISAWGSRMQRSSKA